ncbi:MAG: acyl-ACP--UDP-N-acetylglucosamine O-acyltransferase [Armatimonadetes bacterium]|nr:acyl-ACP--UDP-N-acetylglucosamine O-acyltransferase [Candidatus Hippobium faecium]
MNKIDPTAIIHPTCQLGDNIIIGPYAVIGENVQIGDNTEIMHHAVIEKDTKIGKNNKIHTSAVLGGDPQDIGYHGEKTFLEIGDNNQIREFVTIHRGSREGNITKVGNDNFLMAYVHVGHDCIIHNNVILTAFVGISGHCVVEDYAIIGGLAGLHQFVRVGTMAMIGGVSKVNIDIPPFTLCDGNPVKVRSTSSIGLNRRGKSKAVISALSDSVKIIFHSQLNRRTAISQVKEKYPNIEEVTYLTDFLEAGRQGNNGRQLN